MRTNRTGRWLGVAGLASASLLVTAAVAPPAADADAHGGTEATGLRAGLGLELAGESIIDEQLELAPTTAPADGGTSSDEVIGLDLAEQTDQEQLDLVVEAIRSSSTLESTGTSSDAEIVNATLGLAGTEILHADVIEAATQCPVDGDTSATADLVNARLLDENVNLDSGETVSNSIPIDLNIEGVTDTQLDVTLEQIEQTSADSAEATGLIVGLAADVTLAEQDVVRVDIGDIHLAEAACTTGAADGGSGDDGSDDTGSGDDDSGDDSDNGVPDSPEDVIDDGSGDGDETTDPSDVIDDGSDDGSDEGTDGGDGSEDDTPTSPSDVIGDDVTDGDGDETADGAEDDATDGDGADATDGTAVGDEDASEVLSATDESADDGGQLPNTGGGAISAIGLLLAGTGATLFGRSRLRG